MKPYYERGGIAIYLGDCRDVLPTLEVGVAQSVVTSPPYAMQRANQYGGLPSEAYPAWTVEWMDAARRVLVPSGSVLLNIREHIADGEMADYVHRTRLALRHDRWVECDELIWLKTNAPPLGRPDRPRRSWERILWFAVTATPWCNPRSGGRVSDKIGCVSMGGPTGDMSASKRWGKKPGASPGFHDGIARTPDYIATSVLPTSECLGHPAAYPLDLATWMAALVTPPCGVLVDPFMGGGTTLAAAARLSLGAIGIELEERYCEIAARRLDRAMLPLCDQPKEVIQVG